MDSNQLLSASLAKISAYLEESQKSDTPVVEYRTPEELISEIPFAVAKEGINEEDFLSLIDQYLSFSVRTGNKQFVNQLFSGFNLPAFVGETISALSNTSMYTYEVAPVATIIETEMIALMCQYMGYADGDGIFLTGGSNANLVAMFSARNQVLPESRFSGYDKNQQLVAFVNEHAHYSIDTAANILGIGAHNVIKVKADSDGRMIPSELEEAIENAIKAEKKPFFVAATCATTMMGAYDPLEELADITQKYGIWLHADAAFGGSLILSKKHRHLMQGIQRTDSIAWDPHKLMGIPLICSVILLKKRGILQHNLSDISTDYIYHDMDAIEDLGKKSIQCGRKVDAVKLWFAWKFFGLDAYEKRIENLMELAMYAEKIVQSNDSLEFIANRQSFTICFRYKPKTDPDWNAFNLRVRENLRKSGKTLVNYGYIGNKLAIRFITANSDARFSDIDAFFHFFLEEAIKLDQ